MTPEEFAVYADQLGTAMLCCGAPGCYWEQEIGGMGLNHDLGALLDAARAHLEVQHAKPEAP